MSRQSGAAGGAGPGALSGLLRGGGAEEEGGLAGAMRRLGVGEAPAPAPAASGGPSSGLQYADLAPLVGSYGTRLPGKGMTLATSFRDPHQIPLQPAIREEAEAGVEENSDDEWAARAALGIGARQPAGRGGVAEGGSGARRGGGGGGGGGGDECTADG